MRLKPQLWYLVILLLFAGAICMWRYADKYAAVHDASATKTASPQSRLNQPPMINAVATNGVAKRKSYRITNTKQKFAQLLHNSHALILRNALIDTEVPVGLKIPDHLRAKGAPGSYLVQADRPLDSAFYAELNKAGATYVSYVPNNAALVQASPTQATNLAANADVVAVLPYEPYYKLDSALLPSAVEQQPQTNALSVTTFPGQRDAALAALTQLGATLIGEDRSPFGPTLVVNVPEKSLVAVAQMPLAQEIEVYTPRRIMNDLTRVLMNAATNTLIGTPNYLGLSGSNVTVSINDTGVDATHPDLTGRVQGAMIDDDGHGTHVAGIIAGSGSKSTTVTLYVPGSITTNGPTDHADFRGKATNATLYSQALDLIYGPYVSDAFLQENASVNLGPTNLISNNSWDYGSTAYDIHAASYDAATRDAQPNVDGEQPLLFVFAAGNNGNGAGTINSPATAKNVITVGASDSPRFITNEVYEGTNSADVSEVWYGDTSNTNVVASFSSCGNVDGGVEGTFGRFKPDVVAPGVFTISCRKSDYVFPTYSTIVDEFASLGQTVDLSETNLYTVYLPDDPAGYTASGVTVVISSNASSPLPFPTNMLLLGDSTYPPVTVLSSNFSPANPFVLTNFEPGQLWWFGVASPTNQPGPVNYDLTIYLYETNYLGDYFTVLSNLNTALGSNYLYDSGTSMSAGAVSGTLALMQQFLQSTKLATNPSPALLKAMLINGSRSMNLLYDFDVETEGANEQGWGLPNLPTILPTGLTNANTNMVLIDQSVAGAMSTGQYQSYTIPTNAGAGTYPLRITLVWTDPPGNPAAGVALVNNLELTVADATGTNIFIGNDFLSGDIFTEVSNPTNLPAGQSDNDAQNVYIDNGLANFTSAGDTINNVQNIYINPTNTPITYPLTVTISATRINVNAVTTQTNNILQDYALVIESDDPALTTPLTVTSNGINNAAPVLITVASNGAPLLHQRVGANEPNQYNYPLGDTNGTLSQWHFFIFSNTLVTVSNTTNVAFATFLPPNLSIPRASGSADIDLYVYAPATPLTEDFSTFLLSQPNLDAFAYNAVKSVGRTGTESVIFTNSLVPVYYIGVKSEDQQASDFGFYAIAQSNAFSSTSAGGNTITATGTSLPVFIPNSLSPVPALAFAFMFNPNPVLTKIARATVTLGIQFGTPGSLYGTLQFDDLNTVLNHFSGNTDGFTNTYDDLQEDPNSGDLLSDGPGSLTQYINQTASGLWLLAEANDDQSQSGYITTFTVTVDLQQPTSGFFVTIGAGDWYDGYVDVPNDATNMIISAVYENSAGDGPIGIFETNVAGIITTSDYGTNDIGPPGGTLSLNTNTPVTNFPGAPPLAGGYWYYGIYNEGTAPVTLFVEILIQESLTPNLVQTYTNTGPPVPLTTDGHTQSQICIHNGQQLVDLQVGLLVNDIDLDDLVIHLTSPEGTSVLLFEDRGGTNATSLGLTVVTTNGTGTNTTYSTNYVYTIFTEDTNLATVPIKFAPPPYATNEITPAALLFSNSFETVTNGVYTNGAILEGWLVTNDVVAIQSNGIPGLLTNDEVGIVADPNGELIGATNLGTNYLALTSGHILQTFGVTNNFTITNGMPYQLVFYAKPLGITNWWPANNNPDDIVGPDNGIISNIYTTNISGTNTNIVATPYVTYTNGEVEQAWTFSGNGLSPTDKANGNEVDFGTNAGNFGTNNFTIDFWIKQPTNATGLYGILEKRWECGDNRSFLDIHCGPQPGVPISSVGRLFMDGSSDGGISYGNVFDTNKIINDGVYHHAAFVRSGTSLEIYVDGVLDASNNTGAIFNLNNTNNFRAGQSECVTPGGVGAPDDSQPFVGELDELSLYNRALSPAEIYAIYHAGNLGKFNTNSLLPNFLLTIDGVSTNTIILTNFSGGWELFTNTFYASNNQVTIEFQGNPMGVLFDDIQLVQLAATNYNNYYLPEEPITPFVGENPLGCWTLDVWDTRQDSSQTNNGTLLGWTLQLTTSSTNATLYVLTNEEPTTITNLSSNSIAYFAVDVPSYATFATNLLTANSGGPLTLFFDQNALPTGGLPGDFTLASGVVPATTSTNLLATLGTPPPLLPGRRYFLGVLNNGPTIANFTIEVDFNGMTNKIIPLTNAIAYTNVIGTNSAGTNGPQYYSFTVPPNAVMVTFQIINSTNGEVDLYARNGLPVPGPLLFDYESCDTGTNDQFIVVTTNSLPVALPLPPTNNLLPAPPNIWYLAAYNFAQTNNNNYTIIATVVTNGEITVIPLGNNSPYTNTAAPGFPTNLFYSFTIIDNPAEVQFTVTNLTGAGNVELLAAFNAFPTPDAYYAGSFNAGTNAQLIQIETNSSLPSLNGVWYLAVPNTSDTNVEYVIMATTNLFIGEGAIPAIVPITWNGALNGVADGNWDILSTSNWVVTTNHSIPYPYQNGSVVTFDDSATGATVVNLTQMLTPSNIFVNNNSLTYTFYGIGSISGAPLSMNGFGELVIDNSAPNNFSSFALNNGTLQIGEFDANGSLGLGGILGAGPFDTGAAGGGLLIFERSDNIFIPNVIFDTGTLAQFGTGTLTLSGNNTYSGLTFIALGTLVVGNTNALGSGFEVFIEDGGTLDLGGLGVAYGPTNSLFANEEFVIAGAGVGGNGAIVNNGTNQQQGGLEAIFVQGDASIGGAARWDVRVPGGQSFIEIEGDTLTKTGSNQISLVSTYLYGGFNKVGYIIINQGILSIEATPFFQGIGSITVNSNGLLGQNLDTLGSFTCEIILDGGGTTNLSDGGIAYLDAPILLTNNSSLGNGGGIEVFNGIISGAFGFTNLGPGSNLLSATNTYTGATIIAQGTLALTNTGSITNSTNITVAAGATLDASQRVDQTLTLVSNQTLFDSGTVLGSNVMAGAASTVSGYGTVASNLTINPGAILSPAAGAATIGTFTVGGTASLGGTTFMNINAALSPAPSNDVVMAGSIIFGGTLVVTNLDLTDVLVAGESFQLFTASNSSGAFGSLIPPPLPAGLVWAINYATNGAALTVVNNQQPVFTGAQLNVSVSGTNLVFTGTNGAPGGQFVLLSSTNLLEPLTNWTAILTNFFDSSGDFDFSNGIPTNQAEFYMLQSP
jgi:autotransporter-associated beta strand protein